MRKTTLAIMMLAMLTLGLGCEARQNISAVKNTTMKISPGADNVSALVLKDLGVERLEGDSVAQISRQAKAWDEYQSTNSPEMALKANCGNTTDNILMRLFDAQRKSQNLHPDYALLVTPNPKKWSTAQAEDFGNRTACGIGGYYPFWADQDHILWRQQCIGGTGPSAKGTPGYDRDVACLQVEDAVLQNFTP